jgi:hypothetical protein
MHLKRLLIRKGLLASLHPLQQGEYYVFSVQSTSITTRGILCVFCPVYIHYNKGNIMCFLFSLHPLQQGEYYVFSVQSTSITTRGILCVFSSVSIGEST